MGATDMRRGLVAAGLTALLGACGTAPAAEEAAAPDTGGLWQTLLDLPRNFGRSGSVTWDRNTLRASSGGLSIGLEAMREPPQAPLPVSAPLSQPAGVVAK